MPLGLSANFKPDPPPGLQTQSDEYGEHSQELTISVAMCTFNGAKYIQEQLDSILNQTRLPAEVVICDDGSTDTTLEIVRAFALKASFPVRVISNVERLGSTKNFEKAIGLCSGEIIALCDQDDVWYPEKLEVTSSMLRSDASLGGVFTDGDLTGVDGRPLGVTLWQSFLFNEQDQDAIAKGLAEAVLLRRAVVTGATLAFRSSLRAKLLPIPQSWIHDAWFAWMLCLHSKLGMCSKRLIGYRIHPSQQIGAPTSQASFLKSMVNEGRAQYLDRMRRKHMAEYRDTSQQFGDLSVYLGRTQDKSRDNLFRRSEAKAAFSRRVALAMGMPRLLRFHRILGQTANYFHYSHRPMRLMIRDMIL